MNVDQKKGKQMSVTIRLQLIVLTIVLLIIGIQTWLNIRNARRRNEVATQQHLMALYHEFNEEINLLERTAAALSFTFASQPDVQELFQMKDRQALLTLLTPVFTTLKAEYHIVHLQFHEPNGHIFLRIHDPEHYGDYTFTYRRANAFAIISRQTVAGVEIDPNRLGIQGVSPVFHQGQFIGLVEVGLDYDQAFLEDLKIRRRVDYTMWVTHKDATLAELGPLDTAPESPSPKLFYYAGTNPMSLPIPTEIYHSVLHNGELQTRFVSIGDQELAVLVAPMLGYGDRIIGILEISSSRAEALAALRYSQTTTLVVAGGLALLALVLMWSSAKFVVLRPLRHLTAVAQRQLKGDLTARAKPLPGDEFEQLGHTFNTLTERLGTILRDQEHIIAERTDELIHINKQLQQEISDRKHAEEAIRILNVELEQRVRQRTAELEAANRELKEFAYVVSHDLKAPLRGISRLAHWLGEDYSDVIDDKGREMADLLIGRVKRMDDLIEGILHYSRIGRLEEPHEEIDLNGLLNEVLDFLSPPDHIHITIESSLPVIRAERTRMLQVFQNLIGNAIKFMDKPQGEIAVQCTDNESHWTLSVTDNGPGIEERYQQRIFQIFQTLQPRDELESTGIGLALVKKIVEFYGGTIWVESTVREGSTFFFTLSKKDE